MLSKRQSLSTNPAWQPAHVSRVEGLECLQRGYVNNSPIQDYVHPDDHTQPTYEMTRGFKPFTV